MLVIDNQPRARAGYPGQKGPLAMRSILQDALFLSFSSGIVVSVVRSDEWPVETQVIERAANMQQNCSVLDGNLKILATCNYPWKQLTPGARAP